MISEKKLTSFTLYIAKGRKTIPSIKKGVIPMIENTVQSRCRAAALPRRETTESSPKVSGTFGTV